MAIGQLDLQARIVEGKICRKTQLQQKKNLEAYTGNYLLPILAEKTLLKRSEFQKQHDCGCKIFQHCKNKIQLRTIVYDFSGEIPNSAKQHLKKNAIAIVKEFIMAKGNFAMKNVHFEVKKFATKMQIEIAFSPSVFTIKKAFFVFSR